MLEKPKHLPVYVASYLTKEGKFKDITIISKISKTRKNVHKEWNGVKVKVQAIELCPTRLVLGTDEAALNTYGTNDAKLVSKDVWIRYAKKANKIIDEKNNKEGTKRPRISYR